MKWDVSCFERKTKTGVSRENWAQMAAMMLLGEELLGVVRRLANGVKEGVRCFLACRKTAVKYLNLVQTAVEVQKVSKGMEKLR
jgi:primosomal replication protein N